MKPEIRSNRVAGMVKLGTDHNYRVYLINGDYLGDVYPLPIFSLFGFVLRRQWGWLCHVPLAFGRARSAQAALDALVAAYERSLDVEPGTTCPSCHGSAITTDGDGYAECGDCQCVFLVNAE